MRNPVTIGGARNPITIRGVRNPRTILGTKNPITVLGVRNPVQIMGADTPAPDVPFAPDQISGLQAWYKDTGMVNNGSGGISQWTDASGNGKTLTPISGVPQITAAALNGHDVAFFQTADGQDGAAMKRGSALMSGTAATMFIVVVKDSNWAEAGFYTTRAIAQANHHPFSDNVVYDTFFSSARKTCGPQIVPIADNWRIISIRSQDNNYRIEVDGTPQFSTGTNTFALGSDFVMGAGAYDGLATTYALQGFYAETIIYNAFLTTAQMNQVGNYIATRFALTWNSL